VKSKAEFLAQHPVLVTTVFATLVGLCGWNAFRAGMTYAKLCASVAVADSMRQASEALGG
jgi:hypothetical protein